MADGFGWLVAAAYSGFVVSTEGSGSIALSQGLMGIMTGTGLAEVTAKAFIRVANVHTLPFFTFLASFNNHLLCAEGRRSLGDSGPLRCGGCSRPPRVYGGDNDVGCDG